jgi:hypothetical protein
LENFWNMANFEEYDDNNYHFEEQPGDINMPEICDILESMEDKIRRTD